MKRGYSKNVYIDRRLKKYWPLYLLMLPVFLFFIIYRYIPMGGLVMVFKNYRIARGIFASDWSGLRNFERLFSAPAFPMVIRNTVVISLLKLIAGFPAPVIVALLLNELRGVAFKRSLQTALYLPHFVSWVVLGSLINTFFGPSTGVIPLFLSDNFGVSLDILMKPVNFIGMLVVSDIWKEVGWSSIIYLAAITGIDTELYEATTVDGANRFQQLLKITLPCLIPIIMTMALLRIGGILNAGFEQIFILQNSLVYNLSEILDTYVYKLFLRGEYAISATAGLVKSIVGLILVLITNKIAERYEQEVL
jgi:putative aldouronate transport system permease protein